METIHTYCIAFSLFRANDTGLYNVLVVKKIDFDPMLFAEFPYLYITSEFINFVF